MCAIFGAIAKKPDPDLILKVIIGLSRLQHRGEESGGVVYSNKRQVWIHKKFGLVSQVFTPDKIQEIRKRGPTMIIGQTHYSTSGDRSERNIPPQWVEPSRGRIGLVHNGNIPNLEQKKRDLEAESGGQVRFDEDVLELMNDSEFMIKKIDWLISRNNLDVSLALEKFMEVTPGSYSAALLLRDGVYLFRDSYANRLLYWIETDDGIYFSSETCALNDYDSDKIKEFTPGGIVEISSDGTIGKVTKVNSSHRSLAKCVFEDIYFSKPSNLTYGTSSYEFRFNLGRRLAKLAPVSGANFVSYIPDSGRVAAEGFAFESQKPIISIYERDYYVGRTFISPDPKTRAMLAKIKFTLIVGAVRNKKVVLVDDSIVRGTVMKQRVDEIIKAGAVEVHVRISAPPTISPCYYGIDMKTKDELIAARLSVEEIRKQEGATSLFYLPLEQLDENIIESGRDPKDSCKACFDGNYPIPLG